MLCRDGCDISPGSAVGAAAAAADWDVSATIYAVWRRQRRQA